MDIWTEHFYIRIYGGKICTYRCAPNQEHTNQWFNGWNIVTHRYMAQSLEHINVQQKVTFKNMVSLSECRFISYRHQIDDYNLMLCVFPYSDLCQIDYLDWFPLYSDILDKICQKEIVQECLKCCNFFCIITKIWTILSQHNKFTNPIHSIEKFNLIIYLSRKYWYFQSITSEDLYL